MWQPWTQNLYSYVGNNPVNLTDPTGHVPCYTDYDYNSVYADMGIPGGGCTAGDYNYEYSGDGWSLDDVTDTLGSAGTWVGVYNSAKEALEESSRLGGVGTALDYGVPILNAIDDFREGEYLKGGLRLVGELGIGILGGAVTSGIMALGVAGAVETGGLSVWGAAAGATATIMMTDQAIGAYDSWLDSMFQ